MGFLRFFYLNSVDGGAAVTCTECQWTFMVLDVYDSAELLSVFRGAEDHYYERHGIAA